MKGRPMVRRTVTAAVAVLLAGVTACASPPPVPPPERGASGLTADDLEAFLGNGLRFTGDGDFGLDLARLVPDPARPGGTALRVTYLTGSASRSTGGPEGGLQAYLELPEGPVEALDLIYRVRFPPDFDFVKGGKLPGLYGGTATGGGEIPDGTDGFSTRYMWRAGGAGEVYAYLPTSRGHGTSLGRGCWWFEPGRWTEIHQRVLLNRPDAADGRVLIWQDGRLVLDASGLRFRTTGELRIDGLFFSTFFGGSDSTWASPMDQYTDFAGFRLGPPTGPPPPAGGTGPAACDSGAKR
jgi:hypothetical protein